MNINYLSFNPDTPASGYWDMTFIEDIMKSLPDSDREVFVIPGANQGKMIKDINTALNRCKKVLVFITSDEEDKFPVDSLKHPDMYVFTQYQGTFPLGYTPKTRPLLKGIGYVEKVFPWFYSGQINHCRRQEMQEVLVNMDFNRQLFYPTDGFSKGMKHEDYFEMMSHSKAVPCPPGNVTQDSFRVYEALESGCVPIVDRFSAQGDGNYWERLFPRAPFPIISSYQELPEAIDRAQDPDLINQVFAWWIRRKMKIRQQMKDILNIREAMTIVVTTSPISSHPDTKIIDETIKSIRYHTNMDIIICIDGVRPEQEELREKYTEYTRRLLWKCNFEYENVIPIVFSSHQHQSGMIKEALKWVHTQLLMFVEHDTPLVTDKPIDWAKICITIMEGKANVVRFHYKPKIPPEHEYLMVHNEDFAEFVATKQWSQRPHVARTDFYRDILQFFSPEANCFIEDWIYPKCLAGDFKDWKVFIYNPGGNIQRSRNLNGRKKDYKFDKEQVW